MTYPRADYPTPLSPKPTPLPPKIAVVPTLLAALGLAGIDLLWVVSPGVEPSQRSYYHWIGRPQDLAISIVLDLAVAWLAFALPLLFVRTFGKLRFTLLTGLMLFQPWVLYQGACVLLNKPPARKISFALLVGAFLATSFLTARWRSSWSARFERLVRTATTVLAFAGLFGIFLLLKLGLSGYRAAKHSHPPLRAGQALVQPHRLIWIVMDELSYRQVFEHRFAGLQLPAFDALQQQSTTFTHIVPPDFRTEIILPGLLTGQPWNDLETPIGGPVWGGRNGQWRRFDPHDTIFQDALNYGYSTGVAGWYNPYCRIAAEVLDRCFVRFRDTMTNNMVTSAPVLQNAAAPLATLEQMFLTPLPYSLQLAVQQRTSAPGETMEVPQLHIQDYTDLAAASTQLLRDPGVGFVLLHLPVPHPYTIYNRATGQITTQGNLKLSYIDNLALADTCLANLRQTLEQTGQWDTSTVIVMGDHGFRARQWQIQRKLVSEDDTATHSGQYDQRPAYLVKLPGQTSSAQVDAPFQAIDTRKLLDEILAHRITTPAELTAWAATTH